MRKRKKKLLLRSSHAVEAVWMEKQSKCLKPNPNTKISTGRKKDRINSILAEEYNENIQIWKKLFIGEK